MKSISAALLALVMLVVVPQPVSVTATPGPRSQILALAGTTVINARSGGAVRLHIPERITVQNPGILASPQPDVQLQGGGEFAGFILMPRSQGADSYLGSRIQLGGIRHTDVRRITSRGPRITATISIPAGEYMLYLFSMKGPVTLTLRPPNLEGHTSTDVHHIVPNVIDGTSATTPGLHSAGFDRTSDYRALAIQLLWLETDSHVWSNFKACIRATNPDEMPLRCSREPESIVAATEEEDSRTSADVEFRMFAAVFLVNPTDYPGRWEQAFDFQTISAVRHSRSVSLWARLPKV